jgi:hypothetical protein
MQRDPATDHAGQKLTKPEDVRREIDIRLSALNTQRTIDASKRLDRVLEAGIKEGRMTTALPNRFTEKFTQASGVLERRLKASETRADALIAREAALAKREDEAFAPHEEAAVALEKQYDAIERQYDVLANANPLSGSDDSSNGEKVVVTEGDVGTIIVGDGKP